MPVNVLLITHADIGSALLQATTTAFGDKLPLATTVISVHHDTDPEALLHKLRQFIVSSHNENGLLILTDLFGSTPSNIAANLKNETNVKVISGLNLPMLIRVMNYAQLPLNELADKALSGGKDGIINCNE